MERGGTVLLVVDLDPVNEREFIHMKSMMQFLALRGNGGALTASGSPPAEAPVASRARRPVSASPPNPWNIRPRNSRRLGPYLFAHSAS